jgi:signal transduction histidine kinase
MAGAVVAAHVGALGEDESRDIEERLALVAHELLTPLVVAQGYTSLLADLLGDREDESGELALGAARNLDLAMLLLQRLRDTSANADHLDLDRSEIDLSAVVAQIVDDLRTTVAADHPLSHHEPETPIRVKADEVRVRQVLFNLLVNAAKYSESGAPIEVTLSVDADAGMASVEVRNHGFGVAPEDAERLFQKGARGEGEGPTGLGVGLFISRKIAEAHEGTLHVEPAEKRGSRFLLRLPLG